MKIRIGRLMVAVAALISAAVAGGFVALIVIVLDVGNDSRHERSASEALTASAELQRLTVDLETGVRGFVLQRDRAYLEPYTEAVSRLPELAPQFVQLASHDDDQGARAQALVDGIERFRTRWAAPQIAAARSDPRAAAAHLTAGKRQMDALRRAFARFDAVERGILDTKHREVADKRGQAVAAAAIGLAASLVLLVAAGIVLARLVVWPLQRLAVATTQLARGDFSARVTAGGLGEAAELGAAFNSMADSLEDQRDELEAQNSELAAQQAELARSLHDVERESARTAALYAFGTRLAGESDLDALCRIVLDGVADLASAEVGALAVRSVEDPDAVALAAVRGLDRGQLEERVTAGVGLAGRALAERRPVVTSVGDTSATVRALGRDVIVQHELHVALVERGEALGVLTLGRLGGAPFAAEELELVDHLAHQSTLALANALSLAGTRRLAGINTAVLDAAVDGVAMVDPDGRFAFMNAAMEETLRILGVDPARPLGDQLETGGNDIVDIASGRAFSARTAPVHDASGEPIGRLLTIRETTAEREAARLKDEFVATVSHELRTPLTSINGYVEILLEDEELGELNDEQRRFLEVVARSSGRLMRLVGDLLLVGQIDAGKLELDTSPVDLGVVVVEATESARAVADEKDVAVRTELDAVPPVLGDPARLAQVVDNLLSNAIKFTPGGGDVAVSLSSDDGHCVLEVSDSGIGIPESERAQLFQRFFRTSRASAHAIAGTGLGLAITKAIVDAHGGTIGVVDRDGPGTTFRVELPAANGEGAP